MVTVETDSWKGVCNFNTLTGGGNRTHVAVPKDLLMTIALYHSATEVFIEFNKYFGSQVV